MAAAAPRAALGVVVALVAVAAAALTVAYVAGGVSLQPPPLWARHDDPAAAMCRQLGRIQGKQYKAECDDHKAACMAACDDERHGACAQECKLQDQSCHAAADGAEAAVASRCRSRASRAHRATHTLRSARPASPFANPWCIGKQAVPPDPTRDGNGHLCQRAVAQPGCATDEQRASLVCACCYCYDECGLEHTVAKGCSWFCASMSYLRGAGMDGLTERAPAPARAHTRVRNAHCIGNLRHRSHSSPRAEGTGYICKAALMAVGCTDDDALGRVECACCYCYDECALRDTLDADCREHVTCPTKLPGLNY